MRNEARALDIAYLLRRAGRAYADQVAVDDARISLSHGQLLDQAERLANALDGLGIPSGAPVGLLSENRAEYVVADVALALGRRIRVALNARLHHDDFRYMADDVGMAALFYSPAFEHEAATLAEQCGLRPIALDEFGADAAGGESLQSLIRQYPATSVVRATDPEAAAWISYTSGTTGRPKGVVLSHRSIREVALNLLLEVGPVIPGEQIVLTQPVSHGAGYFVLPYLISGAGVHVMRHFDPAEVWQLSSRLELRTLKLVPAMMDAIFAAEPRAHSGWGFESMVYGASSIAPGQLQRALDRFGPILIQDYGQSEAPVTITVLQKQDHLDPTLQNSAGLPWRSVAVEVRTDDGGIAKPGELGEVYVKGNHLMTGYHGKPAETREVLVDGWLRTKDLAVVDECGHVFLRGRSDEMIISGGFNVAPREVEDVLVAYDGIEEAVACGMPDERWGQAVTAVVRPSPGGSLDLAALEKFAKERLGIRAPKRIVMRDEIPRNAYGKVDRVGLRAWLAGPKSAPEPVGTADGGATR